MIVVAIIGLLAAIALPSFLRARERSIATTVMNELRVLDNAKDQYALDNFKTGTMHPSWSDLTPYMKAGSVLANSGQTDPLGNRLHIRTLTTRVQVDSATKTALSDVTDDTFWGPYS